MHDEDYLQNRPDKCDYLALPGLKNNKRVLYKVLEYDSLMDSSNMTVNDWINIATDVFNNYELFDGFVILHGTDTLCYSASALSFMFENLGKTVIITGSQVSIFLDDIALNEKGDLFLIVSAANKKIYKIRVDLKIKFIMG